VLDQGGEIIHDGGVTAAPGLYALGLRFLRHRSSNFIDGVGRDAEALTAEVAAFLGARLAA
jgi:putative flavoprotein involved in K+ transport